MRKKERVISVYIQSKLSYSCIPYISKPNCFELLAIQLFQQNCSDITVVGCYQVKPSHCLLICFTIAPKSELVLMEFKLDITIIRPTQGYLQLSLYQLINSPTPLYEKHKSFLLDVVETNVPHGFSAAGDCFITLSVITVK